MQQGRIKLGVMTQIPEIVEKPSASALDFCLAEEKEIKDFDEFKEDLVKFSGSEAIWADSWKKYRTDIKTMRESVRCRAS